MCTKTASLCKIVGFTGENLYSDFLFQFYFDNFQKGFTDWGSGKGRTWGIRVDINGRRNGRIQVNVKKIYQKMKPIIKNIIYPYVYKEFHHIVQTVLQSRQIKIKIQKIVKNQNQQFDLRMQKYEQLQKIGQGQFGQVRKVKRISDSRTMAWKQIHYGSMSRQQKNQLISQVNILKQLNHENIVKYYQHFIDKKHAKIYIVMEYCHGGDLGAVLKRKQYLDEELIWKLLYQLVTALNYCHKKKILHRDLKPANIFIDCTKSNVKIGDFGLSKELGQHSEYARTYVGTPYYMSPQQISNVKYNEKSDIWSLGCIIYELTSTTRPFVGSSILELGKNIESGKYKPLPSRYSTNLQQIIGRMLAKNPQDRPSTGKLLQVPMIWVRAEEKELKLQYQAIRKKQEQMKKVQAQLSSKIEQLESKLKSSMNKDQWKYQQEPTKNRKSSPYLQNEQSPNGPLGLQAIRNTSTMLQKNSTRIPLSSHNSMNIQTQKQKYARNRSNTNTNANANTNTNSMSTNLLNRKMKGLIISI